MLEEENISKIPPETLNSILKEEDRELSLFNSLSPDGCHKLIEALKDGPIKEKLIKLSQRTNIEYITEMLKAQNNNSYIGQIDSKIYKEGVEEYINKIQLAKENFEKAKIELEEVEKNNKPLLETINRLENRVKKEEIKEDQIKLKTFKKEINKYLGKSELDGIELKNYINSEKPTWATIAKKDKNFKEVKIKEEKKTSEYEEFIKSSDLIPIIIKAKLDGFSTLSIRRKITSMGIKNNDIIFISTINNLLTEIIIKKEIIKEIMEKFSKIGLTVIQALAYEKLPFSNLTEIESAKAANLRWSIFSNKSNRCIDLFKNLANKAMNKLPIDMQEEIKKKQQINILYTPSKPPKYNVVKNTKRQRMYESPITELITPKNNRVIDLKNENILKKFTTIPSVISENIIIKKLDWADMEVPISENDIIINNKEKINSNPKENKNEKRDQEKILDSNKTKELVEKESNINTNV